MTQEERVLKYMEKLGQPVWIKHNGSEGWNVLTHIQVSKKGIMLGFINNEWIKEYECSVYEQEPDGSKDVTR